MDLKIIILGEVIKRQIPGLPWWLSGKESTYRCRSHGFDPWSGKIPHAVRLPSPCATTADAHALPEKSPHSEQPALHSLRKAACSNEDPGQPKINKII